MSSRAIAYRVDHGRTTTPTDATHTGRHSMGFVSTDFHAPRLTGAQFDSLEEAVERELAAIRSARAATPLPREPRAEASWPRRAMRGVVRLWRAAAEMEAGLDAQRDEVRRQLLADQPRLW